MLLPSSPRFLRALLFIEAAPVKGEQRGAHRVDHQPAPPGRLRDMDRDPQFQVLCTLLLWPYDARCAAALPRRPHELREPGATGRLSDLGVVILRGT